MLPGAGADTSAYLFTVDSIPLDPDTLPDLLEVIASL